MVMTTPRSTGTPRPRRTAILTGLASYLVAGAIVSTGAALVLFQSTHYLNEVVIGILSCLLTANSSLAFGLFWVPWLPKVTELEPAGVVFAPEVSAAPTY